MTHPHLKLTNWLGLVASFIIGLLIIGSATAATTKQSQFGQRKALVIGNSSYRHVDGLPGAAHDARDIGTALQKLGFKTFIVENATLSELTEAFEELIRTSTKEDTVFVFYSGHGFQVGNDNYLAPIDLHLDPESKRFKNKFNLSKLLPRLIKVSKVRVLFLDACRNDPNGGPKSDSTGDVSQQVASKDKDTETARTVVTRAIKTRSLVGYSNGFGRMRSAQPGTFLAYSTASGEVAVDRLDGNRNSPFTTSVLKYIGQPGLDLPNLITKVTREVYQATASLAEQEGLQRQLPWSQSSLVTPFFFVDKTRQEWLAKQLQTMLRTAQCYSGPIDGDWGNGSQAALTRFNGLNSTSFNVAGVPTLQVIEEFGRRLKQAKACPVIKVRTEPTTRARRRTEPTRSNSVRRPTRDRRNRNTRSRNRSASSGNRRGRGGSGCRGTNCQTKAKFSSGRSVVITTTNDKTW